MEVPSVNFSKILGLNVAKPGQEPPTDSEPATVSGGADKTTVTAGETTVAPAVVKDPVETSVVEEVAPKVEHETVVKEHEEKEKTVVDKERHQDHYHTTVVPAQAQEVLPEEHRYEDTATEVKKFQHDDGAAKNQSEARKTGFQDTKEEMKTNQKTVEATEVGAEQVHHHLHETIQPVIEKETIQPITTHKTIHVKEVHQDAAVDEGVTKEAPVSVEDLEEKIERVKPGQERF